MPSLSAASSSSSSSVTLPSSVASAPSSPPSSSSPPSDGPTASGRAIARASVEGLRAPGRRPPRTTGTEPLRAQIATGVFALLMADRPDRYLARRHGQRLNDPWPMIWNRAGACVVQGERGREPNTKRPYKLHVSCRKQRRKVWHRQPESRNSQNTATKNQEETRTTQAQTTASSINTAPLQQVGYCSHNGLNAPARADPAPPPPSRPGMSTKLRGSCNRRRHFAASVACPACRGPAALAQAIKFRGEARRP